jgi:hypothetical protein
MKLILSKSYVNGVGAFSALFHLEGNVIAFFDLVDQAGNVYKYVLVGTFYFNETKSL